MTPYNVTFGRHILATISILALLLCAGGERSASAQQNVLNATMSGRVEDERGASVGGALVSVTSLETNHARTATSDAEGRFRFRYLPVGDYKLNVEHTGFETVSLKITLTVGQVLDLPVRLSVGALAESVQVASDVPLIESARTQISGTVTPAEIDALPLNGRNYLDLALLVPGVSRTNTGSNQRFAETSAVAGTGLSFAGQRNLNNTFIVDGLSANDDAAALTGTSFSQEVVREFQVVTSGGIAEFGRASGGVVNVVTQSGTNDWRGRAYSFLRNQRFDARNPLASSKDPLTQIQYGASAGGPLRPDRLFLFTNFEQTRRNDASVITISPSNVLAVNARLDELGLSGARLRTGLFPSGYDTTNIFVRTDARLSDSRQFTSRYSLYDIESFNARTAGGLNDLSRGSNLRNRDQMLALGLTAALSARTFNEARAQLTRSRLAAPVNDDNGPAINISGVASFGPATFSPVARDLDTIELLDNMTTQRGPHSLKFGADFLYNRVDIEFPGASQGVYTFSSLQNFISGRYINFQQAFGEAGQLQSNPNLGLFIQDEWRPRSDLTVNAGLRYDAQYLPDPIETDNNNFAPRLGIAYAPGDRRTVVRASVGLYFDRIPLRATSNALQRDGLKYRVAVLSFGQAGAPAFPHVLDAFPEGVLTSITTIDPRIENSYSRQANLQIERELPWGISFSAGYIHLRGLHLIMSRNANVPTLPAAEAARLGVSNLGRPDSRFANVSRYESSGVSYYDGMTVALNKRAGSRASFRVSYTLSKAIDTAGNFFFSTPQNNFNLRDEKGPSDNDQRHRLTLSGSIVSPWNTGSENYLHRALANFRLSYLFAYASALPFNLLAGADRNFDTNANDRPAGVGRNAGRGFEFATLDLRLSREFRLTEKSRLEVIAEGFNLLNRANMQLPNNVYGTGRTPLPSFGRPNAAADPRQLQLGLRFGF